MRRFPEIVREQNDEVLYLRSLTDTVVNEKIVNCENIIGTLLTGSVARKDARIAPLGIMIDLAIIVNSREDINLDVVFGKDEEPFIPYHCITIHEKIGLAIEVIEKSDLFTIRETTESNIYAKLESVILYDPQGILQNWKENSFTVSADEIKTRSLSNYFRFQYLTGEYRIEKWKHRKANIQIAQLFNEACECYCNFLYTINGSFIPRKDWLVYLTYEQKEKPQNHDNLLEHIYSSGLSDNEIENRYKSIIEISNWMKIYCEKNSWI